MINCISSVMCNNKLFMLDKKTNVIDLLEKEGNVDNKNYDILTVEEVERIAKGNKLIEVTSRFSTHIIDNKFPKGRFFVRDKDLYVGIYADDRELFVEEFDELYKCALWSCDCSDNFKFLLSNSGMDYKFQVDVDDRREACYWYGGPVVTLNYKNYKIIIEAIGEVDFTLKSYVGNDGFHVIDNENSGLLGEILLKNNISNDYQLNAILETGMGNSSCDGYYKKINSWQCNIKDTTNGQVDKINLGSITLTDAIIELFGQLEDLYVKIRR